MRGANRTVQALCLLWYLHPNQSIRAEALRVLSFLASDAFLSLLQRDGMAAPSLFATLKDCMLEGGVGMGQLTGSGAHVVPFHEFFLSLSISLSLSRSFPFVNQVFLC